MNLDNTAGPHPGGSAQGTEDRAAPPPNANPSPGRSHNIHVVLDTLADEINHLHTLDNTEHRGRQIAMGHKLIAVRRILREQNGEMRHGRLDADGRHPPLGWRDWVQTNLTCNGTHAAKCVRMAVNPEAVTKLRRDDTGKLRTGLRALSNLKRWSTFEPEYKRRITEFVFEQWERERGVTG